MATYGRDVYRWKWDYRVRQLFDLVNPAPGRGRAFTNANLNEYVRQDNAVTQDVATVARGQFTDVLLQPKVDALARVLGQAAAVPGLPAIPRKPNRPADATRDLDNVYPAGSMPTPAALAAARARVGVVPAAPGARGPAAVPGVPARPTGIPPVGPPPANPLPTDNIVLAANPPSLYEAIQDANIRTLARELSDPNYNPEQTFKVTINEPVDGAPGFPIVDLDVTPLQYAALKGLKGVVRYILNNTTSELTKKINGKSIKQAVIDYRKLDTDKNEIQYMFDISEAAIQDATEDFTGDKKLDGTYGNGAVGDVNRILAKKLYEREYNDLKSPKPLSATAPKTSGTLIDDAKKKGKEDGSRGSPINPEYARKTFQEQEAYGQEYDKAFATYQGEKDALLNEDSKFTILEGKLSVAYTDASAKPEHKSAVKKLYDAAYDANRGKTADLIKEAGYVGAYPPSDAVLSGNFFGFGPELSKLVGLNVTGQQPATDTYSKYKEGLVEFVKNLQSILGQAKYAGYMDGLKKSPKYTTPGRISVNGKEYAIDFGKLNTRITELPALSDRGVLQETAESGYSERILTELRRMRDSSAQADSLQEMVKYLRNQIELTPNETIKQLLKPIVVSQKGGATLDELNGKINRIIFPPIKNDIQALVSPDMEEVDINQLISQVDEILELQSQINTLKNQQLKTQFTNQLNTENVDINAIIGLVNQELATQEARLKVADTDKLHLQTQIKKLKNADVQTQLLDRLNDPTLTKKQYFEINTDRVKAYNRELGLYSTIKKLVDPDTKQLLLEEYGAVTNEQSLADLEGKATTQLQRNPLATKIQSLKDKKDFETRFRNADENMDNLKKFVDDQYTLENPGIGTKLQTGLLTAKTAIAAVPGQIVTGLGSVSTKTQLYDLVNNAFSALPKYDEKPIGTIPKGVSPDDPSLDNRVEPLKRVQAIYDREFERGTKEAMRRTGGTRRKTKKSNRLTKKQGSKK